MPRKYPPPRPTWDTPIPGLSPETLPALTADEIGARMTRHHERLIAHDRAAVAARLAKEVAAGVRSTPQTTPAPAAKPEATKKAVARQGRASAPTTPARASRGVRISLRPSSRRTAPPEFTLEEMDILDRLVAREKVADAAPRPRRTTVSNRTSKAARHTGTRLVPGTRHAERKASK